MSYNIGCWIFSYLGYLAANEGIGLMVNSFHFTVASRLFGYGCSCYIDSVQNHYTKYYLLLLPCFVFYDIYMAWCLT